MVVFQEQHDMSGNLEDLYSARPAPRHAGQHAPRMRVQVGQRRGVIDVLDDIVVFRPSLPVPRKLPVGRVYQSPAQPLRLTSDLSGTLGGRPESGIRRARRIDGGLTVGITVSRTDVDFDLRRTLILE